MKSKINRKKESIYILFLFIGCFASACTREQPCVIYRKRFFKKSVNEVVVDKGPEGRHFLITGFDPVSHKKIVFDEIDGFFIGVKALMSIGDTLVKTKNNASFLIKKKDINIIASYDCKGIDSLVFKTDTLSKKDANLIPRYLH